MVMEDVPTRRNPPNLSAIDKVIHAYDALHKAKLVDFFVILAVLDNWNQLIVSINNRQMCDPSYGFLFLLSSQNSAIRKLSQPCSISDTSLIIGIVIV